MSANALIQVRDLQKWFKGGEIRALDGVSADIKKGEVVVVIGPSGSGKSTFLRCLNLLERPTGGTIHFNGHDITDPKSNINIHRQKMGMVFPHFTLADVGGNAVQGLDGTATKVLFQVLGADDAVIAHCFSASSPAYLPAW